MQNQSTARIGLDTVQNHREIGWLTRFVEKIPLMRFFASSLFFALMRFERSETNTGNEGKNSLLTPRTRRRERRQHFFFSCGQHLLRL